MSSCFLCRKCRQIPVRAWIIALIFMTSFMSSMLASNILYIINFMTVVNTTRPVPYCSRTKDGPSTMYVSVHNFGPRYNWSKEQKWQIEAAYFYGVAIASPPAGILAEWLGPKNTIFFPLLFAGVINSLSAFGASWGWGIQMLCRFIVGLASGTVNPALQCFVGRWAPPQEKGKFINAIMGDSVGTAVVWVMIRYTTPSLGWPWAFYIISILITVYCTAFWFLAANNPEEHKYISQEEIQYIRNSQQGNVSLEKEFPPFKKILTSGTCWALTILNFGSMWGVQMQVQVVPKFIEKYMGISTDQSVFFAILPHIARFGSGIFIGNLSDLIISRNMMNNTTMTRIFVIFSHIGPACIMMSLGSVKCNVFAATGLLVLCNLCTAASVGANLRNPTDLSPNFAGTIFGLNMCMAQTTGFIVPTLFYWIHISQDGILGWTIIFLIGGGTYFGTGVIYLMFGSAEVQPWNEKTGKRPLQRRMTTASLD